MSNRLAGKGACALCIARVSNIRLWPSPPRKIQGRRRGQIDTTSPNAALPLLPFGPAEVIAKVAHAAFGKPLVTNVLRAQVVEAMIALVLEPQWQWCSADYAPCDFQRDDGLRLEVKQSAARQSWSTDKPSKAIFDVAARTGRNEADGWVAEFGRAAQIYVFGHLPVFDDSADHRDPRQWLFYVVPTNALPDVKQIALSTIKTLASPVSLSALAATVHAIALRATSEKPA